MSDINNPLPVYSDDIVMPPITGVLAPLDTAYPNSDQPIFELDDIAPPSVTSPTAK